LLKILVVPDKFKGCLSSQEAASLISQAFEKAGHEVVTSPLADGGEGTVEAVLSAVKGTKKTVQVQDPLGRNIKSFLGTYLDADCLPAKTAQECPQTAVIEMAAASGLQLLSGSEQNPLITSTFGTGQLIEAALNERVSKIIIGVGGSATNDGGMGAAAALGALLLDDNGQALKPIGENLIKVNDYDLSGVDERIARTEITVATDVGNPFYGSDGAAFVYGPQKGANEEQVKELDDGLKNLADIIKEKSGLDLQVLKGSGAAGGLAGGLVAFLGAKITPGTQLICELLNLEEKVKKVDLVVTGEGRVDEQTLYGKAPSGVINLAKKYDKKIVMICGQLGEGSEKLEQAGIKLYPLANNVYEAEQCIIDPKPAIKKAVQEIIKDV